MKYFSVPIPIDYQAIGTDGNGHTAELTIYLPDNSREIDPDRRRPTVLIFPGGGYGFRSEREAEPIALKFIAEDCNAAILSYSVAPTRFPAALVQASEAMAVLRDHADEWNINSNKIAVLGFSAGGHLAASYGTLWNNSEMKKYIRFRNAEHKPNGMILCYPVISSGPRSHGGSFENLLGDKVNDPFLTELLSCEKQVTEDTPPAFIWHTFDDGAVPIQNSLLMASALAEKGINTELHIYPHGPHGLSLANEIVYKKYDDPDPKITSWISFAISWLKDTMAE